MNGLRHSLLCPYLEEFMLSSCPTSSPVEENGPCNSNISRIYLFILLFFFELSICFVRLSWTVVQLKRSHLNATLWTYFLLKKEDKGIAE